MTDPENNHHQYRYDKLLRLVEITRNGEVVATYAYISAQTCGAARSKTLSSTQNTTTIIQ